MVDTNNATVSTSWPLSSARFQSLVQEQKPVLFKNAASDWACTKRWNNDYLLERLGDKQVNVTRSPQRLFKVDPERGHYAPEDMQSMPFRQFLDYICNAPENGVCYYLHKQSVEQLKELASDIEVPSHIQGSPMLLMSLWMGARGAITPIHHDFTDNFFVQARGRKRVVIYPPSPEQAFYRLPFRSFAGRSSWHISRVGSIDDADLARFPRFAEARAIQCIAEPGDILYIPKFFWHEVHSLDSPSMSLSYWWSEKSLAEIESMISTITAFMHMYEGASDDWKSLIRKITENSLKEQSLSRTVQPS